MIGYGAAAAVLVLSVVAGALSPLSLPSSTPSPADAEAEGLTGIVGATLSSLDPGLEEEEEGNVIVTVAIFTAVVVMVTMLVVTSSLTLPPEVIGIVVTMAEVIREVVSAPVGAVDVVVYDAGAEGA